MDMHSYFKSASSSHLSCSTVVVVVVVAAAAGVVRLNQIKLLNLALLKALYLYIKGSSEVLNCETNK